MAGWPGRPADSDIKAKKECVWQYLQSKAHKVSGGDVGVNIWLAKVGGKTKAKDEPSEDVSETPGMDPLLSSNPGIHLRTTASTTILQRKNYNSWKMKCVYKPFC